jgi:Nucleotide modification associated domain 3
MSRVRSGESPVGIVVNHKIALAPSFMRIILSRKGVDSGTDTAGLASPILDGSLVSLPIPEKRSQISYADLTIGKVTLGNIVKDLSKGRLRGDRKVHHLDPDLLYSVFPRQREWRPIFGQGSAAQSHLQTCGVTVGDLFLFFGSFREAELRKGKYRYKVDSPDLHVIFGWLQVGAIIPCTDPQLSDIPWARYHSHFRRGHGTAFIASDRLDFGSDRGNLSGGGYFERYHESLRLTAPKSSSRRRWLLPRWCYPRNGFLPLTYHPNKTCFRRNGKHTILESAARGQEFVLDSREYPEAVPWARRLIRTALNES